MVAPENAASHERRLRHTVAELSECAIEDIEAIWGLLSHDEREQLRPLLAEAARAVPGNLAGASFADTTILSGKIDDDNGPAFAQRIARLGESLPNELFSRLIFSVDDRARDALIETLSAERRVLFVRNGYRITERARLALRNAAAAVSVQSCDPPNARTETTPVERLTLGAKMRRWIGHLA